MLWFFRPDQIAPPFTISLHDLGRLLRARTHREGTCRHHHHLRSEGGVLEYGADGEVMIAQWALSAPPHFQILVPVRCLTRIGDRRHFHGQMTIAARAVDYTAQLGLIKACESLLEFVAEGV